MNVLSFATAQLIKVLPRERISRAAGKLADHTWSPSLGRIVVDTYCRLYDVDLTDCAQRSGWSSFDAFFTRSLREGARPMPADPRVLVSPADGVLASHGPVDADARYLVKGRHYSTSELLGSDEEADRYRGGAGCVVYLSPRDYHRVHAPIGGRIARVCSMPGDYFPVNDMGVKFVPNLFARNRRVAVGIDTPEELGLGRVTVVFVAAIVVGRITVSGFAERDVPFGTFAPDTPIARGEELGMFHLGSTAVVFFEPRAVGQFATAIGPTRYGEALMVPGKASRT
ncbi:MAG: phosphatidylserine decarboxylase [Proteobacteria bacterium]|nr:MAG: phosphatidylserine decarboxylase [Pseudomonadota bacterium]